ncbi:endonuclease/exonuclease/phosphatase family protein [Phenylobacterium sp.]|uniref:endonuclease/exonuclease/phosphatase family protein n=1 Tax=Phenylobacterium sp. TaxID=1871053 RepID=UPI002ED908CE
MAEITDPPPQAVLDDAASLARELDNVPAKTAGNLLIATWNIRAFGSLTLEWSGGPDAEPKRDLHAAYLIAEILARFDVIAIQEVKGNLRALRHVLKKLGPQWGFVMTDVSRGDAANAERLAFIFDTARLKLSGLACELVVPEFNDGQTAAPANARQQQFARTPYAVSFLRGDKTFVLVTLHVDYGAAAAERTPELKAIAEWLLDWASRMNEYEQNLICLGDFNIDRRDDERWQAFASTGLTVPAELNDVPRTLSASPDDPQRSHFYDQIAWFEEVGGRPYLSLDFVDAGGINFQGLVLRDLSREALSYRMSDHYPLWAAFTV